jgi:hypothetical protein
MILLKVKDGIQEGNQDFLLVLVAKDFPKSDVVLYVCEFHIKQFVTKIQKPLGLAAVFVRSTLNLVTAFPNPKGSAQPHNPSLKRSSSGRRICQRR